MRGNYANFELFLLSRLIVLFDIIVVTVIWLTADIMFYLSGYQCIHLIVSISQLLYSISVYNNKIF